MFFRIRVFNIGFQKVHQLISSLLVFQLTVDLSLWQIPQIINQEIKL